MKPIPYFQPALFAWQFRQLWLINAVALSTAVIYTLFRPEPLVLPGEYKVLFAVIVHSAAVVRQLGRISSSNTGFLYSQGFTRDRIWRHTLAATAASACLVSAVVFVLIAAGLRSFVQSTWFNSPWYPFMTQAELKIPLLLLFEYAVVMPLMHYVWIRAGQPAAGAAAGWMLMSLGLCFTVWAFGMAWTFRWQPAWYRIVALLYLPAFVVLLIACRQLHRTMEVRS